MKRRLRSWKILLPLAVVAIAVGVAATAALAAKSAGVIRLAIMSDCKGAFAGGYELDIGGAQAALAASR